MKVPCCPRCGFPIPDQFLTSTRGGLEVLAPLQRDAILCCAQPGCITVFRLTDGAPSPLTEAEIAKLSPTQQLWLANYMRGNMERARW